MAERLELPNDTEKAASLLLRHHESDWDIDSLTYVKVESQDSFFSNGDWRATHWLLHGTRDGLNWEVLYSSWTPELADALFKALAAHCQRERDVPVEMPWWFGVQRRYEMYSHVFPLRQGLTSHHVVGSIKNDEYPFGEFQHADFGWLATDLVNNWEDIAHALTFRNRFDVAMRAALAHEGVDNPDAVMKAFTKQMDARTSQHQANTGDDNG